MIALQSLLPPTDDTAITRYEAQLGFAFPASYRAFLLSHNGGIPLPAPSSFTIHWAAPALPGQPTHAQVDTLFGIAPDEPGLDLLEHARVHRDRLPVGMLPIGEDGAGNLLLLAVSGARRGQVMFRMRGDRLGDVAKDFDAFLAGLQGLPG